MSRRHSSRRVAAPARGKTRVTIYLDNAVLNYFKTTARRTGGKYQTLVNAVLATAVGRAEPPLTATLLRRILQEELRKGAKD